MEEQLDFLRLIAARLHAAGIPYMVTGSLAQAVWAVPRMTRDIDVVVEAVGTAIAFVSPEDLILSKLVWGEDSHSELQRNDVRQLVEAVEDLDWDYLQAWAGELGVRDALERIGES